MKPIYKEINNHIEKVSESMLELMRYAVVWADTSLRFEILDQISNRIDDAPLEKNFNNFNK